MRLLLSFSSLTLLLAALGACSSDGTASDSDNPDSDAGNDAAVSPPTPVPEPDANIAKKYCEASVARDQVCPARVAQRGPTDETECLAFATACMARTWSTEATELFAECYGAGRSCTATESGSDDECYAEAGAKLPANRLRDVYLSACQEKLTTCDRGSFLDDWCTQGGTGWEMFNDYTYQRYIPCFAKPCDEIRACLNDLEEEFCPIGD